MATLLITWYNLERTEYRREDFEEPPRRYSRDHRRGFLRCHRGCTILFVCRGVSESKFKFKLAYHQKRTDS
jgi:hypothetical protein